jgi:hypothetical protein
MATSVLPSSTVTVTVGSVDVDAPDQPTNVYPAVVVAVTVTIIPFSTRSIVPPSGGNAVVARVDVVGRNMATSGLLLSILIVTVISVDVDAPVQPANVYPAAASAITTRLYPAE